MANTACEHSKEIVSKLKNALASDETARKETAASRERSGCVPDVGLASILRKQTISQENNSITDIDITSKMIQAERNKLANIEDTDVSMKSIEVETEASTLHKIHTKDNVTEMIESKSSNNFYISRLFQ